MVMTTPTRVSSQMEENLVPGVMVGVSHQVVGLGGREGGKNKERKGGREGGREGERGGQRG